MKHHTKQATVSLAFKKPERQHFKANMLKAASSNSKEHSAGDFNVTGPGTPFQTLLKMRNLMVQGSSRVECVLFTSRLSTPSLMPVLQNHFLCFSFEINLAKIQWL